MNKNSNVYTIVYAAVMVIIVAVGLAFTSQVLKEKQKNNQNVDKMQQILRSLKVEGVTADNAVEKYNEIIKDAYLVDGEGRIQEEGRGADVKSAAFTYDLVQIKRTSLVPVFVAEISGETKYVLGLYGAGLWNALWGYIALDSDRSTVYGVDFSHAGETPGLGAEITKPFFPKRFEGLEVFSEGKFRSISVVKPGDKKDPKHEVDGISGSTLTCKGVDAMLFDSLKKYEKYLKDNNNQE